jgi:hypothetical protein
MAGFKNGSIDFKEKGSDPSAPESGHLALYAKDGALKVIDSDSNVTELGAGGGGGASPTGHLLFVDAVNGDDTAGAADPYTAPFLTLEAALDASSAGDTIVVRPGTYTPDTDYAYSNTDPKLLKDGVNWYFMPNAIVVFGNAGGQRVLFHTGTGTVNAKVLGHLKVINVYSDGSQACVLYAATDGDIDFEFDEINSYGYNIELDAFEIHGAPGKIRIKGNRIIGTGTGAGGFGIECITTGGSSLNLDVQLNQIEFVGYALKIQPDDAAARVKIKCNRIVGNGGNQAVRILGTGTVYLEFDECVNGLNATSTAALVYIKGKHLYGTSAGGGYGLLDMYGGRVFANIQEIDGGTNSFPSVVFYGNAYAHLTSQRVLGGSGSSSAYPVAISNSGGTYIINGGTSLVSGHASAPSIGMLSGGSETIKIYGVVVANHAADGSVTAAVGTLTVDAAVV